MQRAYFYASLKRPDLKTLQDTWIDDNLQNKGIFEKHSQR